MSVLPSNFCSHFHIQRKCDHMAVISILQWQEKVNYSFKKKKKSHGVLTIVV